MRTISDGLVAKVKRTCGAVVTALAVAITLGSPGLTHAGDKAVARPFKGSAQGYITGQIRPNTCTPPAAPSVWSTRPASATPG